MCGSLHLLLYIWEGKGQESRSFHVHSGFVPWFKSCTFSLFQLLPLTVLCLLLVRGFHLGSSSKYILVSTIERTFGYIFQKINFVFWKKMLSRNYYHLIIVPEETWIITVTNEKAEKFRVQWDLNP